MTTVDTIVGSPTPKPNPSAILSLVSSPSRRLSVVGRGRIWIVVSGRPIFHS